LGLEKPNSGPDPGETFFPNSVSDLGSAETFPKSRNVGPVIDENVCLLDSQPCLRVTNEKSRIRIRFFTKISRIQNTGNKKP